MVNEMCEMCIELRSFETKFYGLAYETNIKTKTHNRREKFIYTAVIYKYVVNMSNKHRVNDIFRDVSCL